jgi:hypothetical protein
MISVPATRVKVAIWTALAVGIALRVAWWIMNPPIWLDEAMLVLGIIHRPLGAVLSGPLPYGQLAPPGYLIALWLAGTSARALRAVSLVASIISLPLFAALARRVLREESQVIAAVWLFAIDRALVTYAIEVKPYAWDVTAAVVLLLVVLWARDGGGGGGALRALGAGVLGAVLVWCSFPAVLVLAALGLVWLVRTPRTAAVPVLMWVASAAPAIWLAEHRLSGADRAYLRVFWADGFGLHPIVQSMHVLDTLLRVPPGIVWLAAAIIGAWLMPRRIVLVPVVAAIIAAAAGAYPLASRLALYLVPSALLALAALAGARGGRWGRWVIAALVIAQGVESVSRDRHEDMRTVAKAMAPLRQKGDDVYVYYSAVPAFTYYSDTTGIVRGGCHRSDWRRYLDELDAFRGKPRVWLVVAHAFDGNGVREDSLLVRYLDTTGRVYLTLEARSAFAVLYDLRDAKPVVGFAAPRSTRPLQPNLVCRVN